MSQSKREEDQVQASLFVFSKEKLGFEIKTGCEDCASGDQEKETFMLSSISIALHIGLIYFCFFNTELLCRRLDVDNLLCHCQDSVTLSSVNGEAENVEIKHKDLLIHLVL